MAKAGEDLAIAPLIQLMSAPQLSDFEKRGCVSALAATDDPRVPKILRDIVAGDFPMDCRIDAAGDLPQMTPKLGAFFLRSSRTRARIILIDATRRANWPNLAV